ncbi:MAG: enoyl-CoA hydratase/isomerase family protein [Syntrophales bacterium]|nr:enoyl-CoA hydratase/isomerase family protein [Syntrophales bacterium]
MGLLSLAEGEEDRLILTEARVMGLLAKVEALAHDESLGLVLVTGGAKTFCLGADLPVLRASEPADMERYLRAGQALINALIMLPVPTVAAVGGLALGGGFEVALACDLRWAHRRAVFALPEVREGIIPAWGAIFTLVRELPCAYAWELLLGIRTGTRIAHQMGLVGRVFDGPDFSGQVWAAAQELALLGGTVTRALKSVWGCVDKETARDRQRAVCMALLTGDKSWRNKSWP